MNDAHSPDTVIRLAQEGRLEEWVHTFLESIGGNVPMSDGLRLQPRFWVGPVVIPLDRLARGWAPPPLIAQFLP
ncbi:MAG: chromosome partitioning protein ParB, partial [Bacillota bacterium]